MLEKTIQYYFKNKSLLNTALTHKSYNVKGEKHINNERLEFLGDSILGFCVAEYLYNNYSNLPEGELTKIRSMVVCEKALFRVAKRIGIGKFLNLGRGEEYTDGRNRPSILSDAMEALFAAVYLDSDIFTVKEIIIRLIEPEIHETINSGDYKDFKTLLQEFTQKDGGDSPEYCLVREEGPDHDKTFTVSVSVFGKVISEGTGRSKKEAEKQAAKKAMAILNSFNN